MGGEQFVVETVQAIIPNLTDTTARPSNNIARRLTLDAAVPRCAHLRSDQHLLLLGGIAASRQLA